MKNNVCGNHVIILSFKFLFNKFFFVFTYLVLTYNPYSLNFPSDEEAGTENENMILLNLSMVTNLLSLNLNRFYSVKVLMGIYSL